VSTPIDAALGTRLRHALDLMESDVAKACADVGLADYRPRFSPVVRALLADGPCPIRELAGAIGVTHSAASQTVAQMHRAGLVALSPGADGRERIARLTPKARRLLPAIQAEWAATTAAATALDAELPYPLSALVAALHEALGRRSFRQRIADAAGDLDDPSLTPFRPALTGTAVGRKAASRRGRSSPPR
jgi:DNA-binding MarR family transcriptional regulator